MRDTGHDRLLHLDGLRALAVLSVVVYHAWGYGGFGGQPLVARTFAMGAHGVDLFFVLSGFCLAYPYLRRFRSDAYVDFPLALFAAKRVARIVPPYWLALITVVALGMFHVLAKPPPLLDILKQLVFFDRDVHFAIVVFWTLPIEFRWYFVFPIALIAYLRAPRFVLAVAAGSYVLYDFAIMNGTPDFGTLPAFLAGIWAADLYITRSPLRRLALPTFLLYGLIAFALEPDVQRQFYAVEPLGVLCVLAFVVFAGAWTPLRMILSHPALTTLGGAAYGIYLVHDPILQRLETVDHIAPWLAVVAAVALSFGFSLACERPFVKGPVRDWIVRVCGARFAYVIAALGLPEKLTLVAQARQNTVAPDRQGTTSANGVGPLAVEVV